MRITVLILSCFLALSLCVKAAGGGSLDESQLVYRVNSRFGEDTETLPKSWRFGVISAVAVTEGEVFVYQRGKNAPPSLSLTTRANTSVPGAWTVIKWRRVVNTACEWIGTVTSG